MNIQSPSYRRGGGGGGGGGHPSPNKLIVISTSSQSISELEKKHSEVADSVLIRVVRSKTDLYFG